MTRRPADARRRVPGPARRRTAGSAVALALGLGAAFPAVGADAACLMIDTHPDPMPLARIALPANDPSFTVRYVHSVTRTPVDEDYRVEGDTIVQTALRFSQHGPGLPTEADPGASWRTDANGYTVTLDRRHASIAMRVHADQSPRLLPAGGARPVDLARWGNRAITLTASSTACAAGDPPTIR